MRMAELWRHTADEAVALAKHDALWRAHRQLQEELDALVHEKPEKRSGQSSVARRRRWTKSATLAQALWRWRGGRRLRQSLLLRMR